MLLLLLLWLLRVLMRRGRTDGLRRIAIKSASQHDVAMADGDAGDSPGGGGGSSSGDIGEEAEDDRFPWPADLKRDDREGSLESGYDVSNTNIKSLKPEMNARWQEMMKRSKGGGNRETNRTQGSVPRQRGITNDQRQEREPLQKREKLRMEIKREYVCG